MQVQVNTSNGVENKETLERWAGEFLNDALSRFRQEITRVEVQMSDENSAAKGAADATKASPASDRRVEPPAADDVGGVLVRALAPAFAIGVLALVAPRAPKAVWLPPPPNAPAMSAPFPCWRRTTRIRNRLTIT